MSCNDLPAGGHASMLFSFHYASDSCLTMVWTLLIVHFLHSTPLHSTAAQDWEYPTVCCLLRCRPSWVSLWENQFQVGWCSCFWSRVCFFSLFFTFLFVFFYVLMRQEHPRYLMWHCSCLLLMLDVFKRHFFSWLSGDFSLHHPGAVRGAEVLAAVQMFFRWSLNSSWLKSFFNY